ncbi:MAG: PQQ-dependent sugar dehydrogenase [Verrucomicrobiota bacterium]
MISKNPFLLLFAGLSLHAQAALLVYEGFDYAVGPFTDANGHNGGTGWDGAWFSINGGSPTETIESGSLVSPVPHLPSSGGFLRVSGSGDRFHRNLDSQNFGADGTTIYISFLARQLGTSAPNGAIELTKNNGSAQNIATFGSDTNRTDSFGAVDKSSPSENEISIIGTGASALAPDTDVHLWVIRIDYAAGDDTMTLWYDGVEQGSAVMGDLSFDEFGALFFSGTAGMEIDEVRIGTTLDDVAVTSSIISLEPAIKPLASGVDASVTSDAPVGSVVGVLSSVSPGSVPLDPGTTYSLTAGVGDEDNGLFTIVGQELRTDADLSAESGNILNLRVTGTGSEFSGEIPLQVVVVDPSLVPGYFSPGTVSAFLNGNFPTQTPSPASGAWVTENAFPNLSFNELIGITVEPRSNHLYILERDGDVFRVENNPVTATKTEVLSVNVTIRSNGGFRSFVCHPEFNLEGSPHEDEAFIFYSTTEDGDFVYRLSRVTRGVNGVFGSEQVMIQQHAPDGGQHFSGALAFDENGYLIVTMGDMELSQGGTGVPLYQDVQRIDRIFQGAILRLDVDMQGGATSFPATHTLQGGMVNGISTTQSCLPSHPYYSDENLSGVGYYIPADNYFVLNPPAAGVGGTGYPVHGDALEEHQALGVRNPWRLAYDPVDHDMVWFSVGSNGTERYEEIELLVPGGNYGWPFAEAEFSDSAETGRTTPPSLYAPNYLGVFDNSSPKQTDPLWYYSSIGTGDRAIAGGVMYRGSVFPELTGKLIYGDSASGRIWTLDYKGKAKVDFVNTLLLDSTVLVRQMTAGPQGEKIFMVDGTGVYLLTKSVSGSPEPPALLSQTGAFTDLVSLAPAPGMIPVQPASPLWSDRSDKIRWIALPNADGNAGEYDLASEKIVFSEDGDWTFPPGTVFIKHFELALDESFPEVRRRLETRFLVLGSDDVYYGVTYRWRPDGSEADLITDAESETFTITPVSGPSYQQIWDYPSRQDCLECHRASASSVLGVRTRQLNHTLAYPGNPTAFNQLSTLRGLEVFTEPSFDVPELETYLRSVAIDDPAEPLEHRVRSYLDANCAMCHDGVQNGQALFDARLTTPLAAMGIVDAEPEAGDLGVVGSKIIKPGDPSLSVLFLRDGRPGKTPGQPSGDPDRMPPLSRNVLHDIYLDELEAWILQLGLPEYQLWVESNGVLGAWNDDDDGDDSSNLFEFTVGTDARSASSVFRPVMAPDFSFSMPVTGAARTDGVNVTTQDSGNLVDWFDLGQPGSAATLDSDTSAPGTDGILKVMLGSGESRRFVRGKVSP